MPTELEELVDFLHHGNTQIRQIACENLVGYSASQPALFKRHQLLPVRDLKLLVKDYPPIAKDALTILINLSADDEVLKELAEDDAFLETLLKKVTNPKEKAATEITMLLANLAKSDSIKRVVSLERAVPEGVSTSKKAMDQLMDCFIKGGDKDKEQDKTYDYLSYFFADISKFEEGRAYFVTEQAYDAVIPITKLIVFTEHRSHIRRRGVASTIKNVAFDVASHPVLMSEEQVNLLPYILLPLAGPEEFTDEESSDMLPDLQLLPPDKQRDPDPDILTAHLETLLLLTSTRDGRDTLRRVQVYPLIRECHLHTNNESVQEACDRLVQVIMRDEEGEGEATEAAIEKARLEIEAKKAGDEDEEKVVDDPTGLQVRPCIAELIRTRCPPPKLLLRVERVIEVIVRKEEEAHNNDKHEAVYKAYRLFLSDGEYTIQALLKSELHVLASSSKDDLTPGTVLDIQDYELRTANRPASKGTRPGRVVFLAVARYRRAVPFKLDIQLKIIEDEHLPVKRDAAALSDEGTNDSLREQKRRQRTAERDEAVVFRAAVENTNRLEEIEDAIKGENFKDGIQGVSPCYSTTPKTLSSTLMSTSLKILTLSDLLAPRIPFPKRNYPCNVIAVISWISPQVIQRAHMPPKRDLRLIDPTIIETVDKRRSSVTTASSLPSTSPPSMTANWTVGISMSVFIDAAEFHPPVGTVAFFRGIKTHEWDGISLNAYEKDCRDKEWFTTDPDRLASLGVDSAALKNWWLHVQTRWEDARKASIQES
ncbi:hypothetical protein TMEN_854 [Trichophyton mentagrophytes]|nr:hypothetical protein TMEN_854 [Trichophyton mentagrophytes]